MDGWEAFPKLSTLDLKAWKTQTEGPKGGEEEGEQQDASSSWTTSTHAGRPGHPGAALQAEGPRSQKRSAAIGAAGSLYRASPSDPGA